MKKQLMTLAALAAIAAGCSNDDENIMVNPDQTPDTPISLTANVAGLNATRAITDEGKLVDATLGLFVTTQNVNNSRYAATNMLWTGDALGNWTSAATVLYEGANSTQSAYAYSPHSADYDATAGTVSIDLATQTDYLYAAPTALTGSSLALNMVHRLSKLTVDITGRGTEVATNDNVAAISLGNLPTTATWALANDSLALATTTGTVVTDSTSSALVLPGTESFSVIITMESGRIFKAAVTAPTGGLASGTAYTVSLTVGKDTVTVSSITVSDWVQENMDGGETEEVLPEIDATTMTATELNKAVAEKLAYGLRNLEITLAADASAQMITAIRRAICDTEGVADGSINLTLKGVTRIPGNNHDGIGFGQHSGEWDENDVAIVSPEMVTQLASVNLPDVQTIGARAFLWCQNLVSVTAPKVQTIGEQAFNYTALTSVEFPELTTISHSIFAGTYTLTSAKFPKVTTIEHGGLLIGSSAFNDSTPFSLELTAEGDITFNDSSHFNNESQNYSGKVDLVLHANKKDAVTFNEDGTATWQVRDDLSYTFKSITFEAEEATE